MPDLKAIYDKEPAVKKLLDISSNIEGYQGTVRSMQRNSHNSQATDRDGAREEFGESQIVTQYSMEPVEKLGLVKMDFLGLRTLSVIEGPWKTSKPTVRER